jgi:hypothetical protein
LHTAKLTDKLTDKQRQALLMRYTYGWRLSQIAKRTGTTRQSVCELLQRANLRLGFPRLACMPIRPAKCRRRRRAPLYLSELPQAVLDGL